MPAMDAGSVEAVSADDMSVKWLEADEEGAIAGVEVGVGVLRVVEGWGVRVRADIGSLRILASGISGYQLSATREAGVRQHLRCI